MTAVCLKGRAIMCFTQLINNSSMHQINYRPCVQITMPIVYVPYIKRNHVPYTTAAVCLCIYIYVCTIRVHNNSSMRHTQIQWHNANSNTCTKHNASSSTCGIQWHWHTPQIILKAHAICNLENTCHAQHQQHLQHEAPPINSQHIVNDHVKNAL